MYKPTILFPEGSGGHWLINLICHLEENDNKLPTTIKNFVFDNEKKSEHFYLKHDTNPEETIPKDRILFSTTKSFNIFLNFTTKKVLNKDMNWQWVSVNDLTLIKQFECLTDHAIYIINSQAYSYYYKNIDLEYDLIFNQPDIFIEKLFNILDGVNLKYHKNKEYCRQSIKNYISTLSTPSSHIGNLDSLIWASWCHAISIIHQINIAGSLFDCNSLNEIHEILQPYQHKFLELSKPLIFEWEA